MEGVVNRVRLLHGVTVLCVHACNSGNRLQAWRCVWHLGQFEGSGAQHFGRTIVTCIDAELVDVKLRNNCLGQGLKESELRKCVLVNLPRKLCMQA